jgi:hypothetical protein
MCLFSDLDLNHFSGCCFQRGQLAKTVGSADRGLEEGRVTEVFGIMQILYFLRKE